MKEQKEKEKNENEKKVKELQEQRAKNRAQREGTDEKDASKEHKDVLDLKEEPKTDIVEVKKDSQKDEFAIENQGSIFDELISDETEKNEEDKKDNI